MRNEQWCAKYTLLALCGKFLGRFVFYAPVGDEIAERAHSASKRA
jgi:hypothetical protein